MASNLDRARIAADALAREMDDFEGLLRCEYWPEVVSGRLPPALFKEWTAIKRRLYHRRSDVEDLEYAAGERPRPSMRTKMREAE